MIKLNSCRPPLSQFPVIKSTDNSRQKEKSRSREYKHIGRKASMNDWSMNHRVNLLVKYW